MRQSREMVEAAARTDDSVSVKSRKLDQVNNQSINQSLHLIATLVVAIFSGHESIQDVLDILTNPPLRALSRSHPAMATNGTQVFAPVLAALQTMQSNVDRAQKGQAHEFLEQFQKSVRRFHLWSTV